MIYENINLLIEEISNEEISDIDTSDFFILELF